MEANEKIRASLLEEARGWVLRESDDIEIRRNIARRYSDSQLDEILILCAALRRFEVECVAWLAAPEGTRQCRIQAFDEAFRTAVQAQHACEPLLSQKLRDYVAWAIGVGSSLLDDYPLDGPQINGDEDSVMDATFSALIGTAVEIILDLRLAKPP